jgi:hypothetical protein
MPCDIAAQDGNFTLARIEDYEPLVGTETVERIAHGEKDSF